MDTTFVNEKVSLGDTLNTSFVVYNHSDSVAITIGQRSTDFQTVVTMENENGNKIAPQSFRKFNVRYVPNKVGDLNSKVSIGRKIVFNIYARVEE